MPSRRGERATVVAGVAVAAMLVGAGGAAYLLRSPDTPPAQVRPVPAAAPVVRPPAVDPVPGAQRALRELGYQVREVTGEPDEETRHAIVAFQKVNRLGRTGELDETTLERLTGPGTPASPVPRVKDAGFHVEVDLASQVLFTVRDGVVERIYDASTGGPDAATPSGDFRVRYQIDGMRYAPLGPMYRPSYLTTTGIAIHGGEPVEPYPASNGCVRLTDPSVDELFDSLGPGTRVLVR